MDRYLAKMGHHLPDFPVVVQFNKRDLPNILPTKELKEKMGVGNYPRECSEP